jgi:hypothetical protein
MSIGALPPTKSRPIRSSIDLTSSAAGGLGPRCDRVRLSSMSPAKQQIIAIDREKQSPGGEVRARPPEEHKAMQAGPMLIHFTFARKAAQASGT